MAENLYLNMKDNPEAARVWNNFMESIVAQHGDSYTWGNVTDALANYNAKYQILLSRDSDYIKKHYLRFGSEAELTAFVLRWS